MEQTLSQLNKLESYLIGQDFKGYDPFDALNSRLLSRLSFGESRLKVAWIQLLKRLPLNPRPVLGIEKNHNAQAMAIFLQGYLAKWKSTGEALHLERAKFFAHWLLDNPSRGFKGLCWGYPFPWSSRSFSLPRNTPTVVNTAKAGHALLDYYEATKDAGILRACVKISAFFLQDLAHTGDSPDELCFSYTPMDRLQVHNASLLGAAYLARLSAFAPDCVDPEIIRKACRFSLRRQRSDGSWAYGEAKNQTWVDSFHTCYVLDSLAILQRWSPSAELEASIRSGLDYFLRTFISPEGRIKYYSHRMYPLNIHAHTQAVITLVNFSEKSPECLALASRVVKQMTKDFWLGNRFLYERSRFHANKLAYTRWSDAFAFKALAYFETARRANGPILD